MEEITISERRERSGYITYLYNALMDGLIRSGGTGELLFCGERTALRLSGDGLHACLREKIAEVIAVGYKYEFFEERLRVSLPVRERKLLIAALIAADREGDSAYVRGRAEFGEACALDGLFAFRLRPLREKWEKIASYVPAGFSKEDLKQFCAFLAGESRRRIYVKGSTVFGENFAPLRLSRLTGGEDPGAEIVLSDAGRIYCLGTVERSVEDFLQNYYAERAIFS